jgi:hypothetical protein
MTGITMTPVIRSCYNLEVHPSRRRKLSRTNNLRGLGTVCRLRADDVDPNDGDDGLHFRPGDRIDDRVRLELVERAENGSDITVGERAGFELLRRTVSHREAPGARRTASICLLSAEGGTKHQLLENKQVLLEGG